MTTTRWSWKETWGDAMRAKVNSQLLATTSFDSGALGLLAMVVHQFPSPGHYRAVVKRHGRAVADLGFEVDEEFKAMQLDIDLARVDNDARGRPGGCECASSEPSARKVSPKGYVLFHASSGDGYSVTVADAKDEAVFDSERIGNGDLFAVSVLEPASYSMRNEVGGATGEIVVGLPPAKEARMSGLETRHIDVGPDKFDPDHVELTSSQGLVFRINKGEARIVIEKKQGKAKERPKPVLRWQKLRSVQR